MSDSVFTSNYKPSGELQGDTRAMPDRGTSTGMTGVATDFGGYSIDVDATNRMGAADGTSSNPMEQDRARDANLTSGGAHTTVAGNRMSGTDSDPMAECYVDDPAFGPAPGDAAEDRGEGY